MNKKQTDAGVLYSWLGLHNKFYFLYTKSNNYRGGKKRSQKKTCMLLTGSAISYTVSKKGKVQKERLKRFRLFHVSADTPHLLLFTKGSWFIECWNKKYSEEKYHPFYEMKK